MQQYQNLLRQVLYYGTLQSNRTGVDTLTIPGAAMQFDLADGFPVVTTRKAPWRSAIAEMVGFINGWTDSSRFAEAGCGFWDQNANRDNTDLQGNTVPNPWLTNTHRLGENDLGEIYGHQWRNWRTEDGTPLDQLYNAVDQIINNPTSRRILVTAWRPDRLDRMALPPCHVMFQFLVNVQEQELNMCMYIRSNDLFLGAPSNIVEYAFLLHAVAMATGLKPRVFTYFVADAHIYVDHVEQVEEQLTRTPRPLPEFIYNNTGLGDPEQPASTEGAIAWLEKLRAGNFYLTGYDPYPPLYGKMAG